MEDKRMYKRSFAERGSAPIMVSVDCGGVYPELAKVTDYSSSGLSMLIGAMLTKGKEITISLERPELTNIELTGKVAWVVPEGELWHVGVDLKKSYLP
jgi:hypothetical protein